MEENEWWIDCYRGAVVSDNAIPLTPHEDHPFSSNPLTAYLLKKGKKGKKGSMASIFDVATNDSHPRLQDLFLGGRVRATDVEDANDPPIIPFLLMGKKPPCFRHIGPVIRRLNPDGFSRLRMSYSPYA